MVEFFVGVWTLRQLQQTEKFMFSFKRIRNRKDKIPTMPNQRWIMDSGAFSEISLNGKYTYSVDEYLNCVLENEPNIFVTMDWMCEPHIIEKTGLSIKDHLNRTIDAHIKIKEKIDHMNIKSDFMGTIQGWKIDDYLKCIDMLKEHGLIEEHLGIGSICRRNADKEILKIIKTIHGELPNVKLHGFGIKLSLLKSVVANKLLHSCDSMAWSFAGRKVKKKPCIDCHSKCKNCANCHIFMSDWLEKINQRMEKWEHQTQLFSYDNSSIKDIEGD